MSWLNSPQYLKGIQKIRAMSPEDKAITQTLVNSLHGRYADADMRKQLNSMRQASMNKRIDRDLELANERLDLKEDAVDFRGDQNKTAENLGWANIALSGLTGYADMKNKKKLGVSIQDIIKNIPKLYK